jgi:hypothetical protein
MSLQPVIVLMEIGLGFFVVVALLRNDQPQKASERLGILLLALIIGIAIVSRAIGGGR